MPAGVRVAHLLRDARDRLERGTLQPKYALERRGVDWRKKLPTQPTANHHDVTRSAHHRLLAGVLLHSLGSLRVQIPAQVGDVRQLALGLHTLNIIGTNVTVSSARIRTMP